MSGHHGVRSFVICAMYNDIMKMPECIETKRLFLRVPLNEDASAVFTGWTQDKEVTRYLTWRPHQQIEQTQEFIRNCLSAWEQETRFPYMICLKDNRDVIGMIDLCHDRRGKHRFSACLGESRDAMRRDLTKIYRPSKYQSCAAR